MTECRADQITSVATTGGRDPEAPIYREQESASTELVLSHTTDQAFHVSPLGFEFGVSCSGAVLVL